MPNTTTITTHCGYIAIIGRPNAGKSTLLNKILGEKVSITARKPQTTRHKILGIKTVDNKQMIYVDTPGVSHKNNQEEKCALNHYMFKAALSTINDVDLIIFVVDAMKWYDDDTWLLKKLRSTNRPIILAINKTDEIKEKGTLLPYLATLQEKGNFVDLIPISAKQGTNIKKLEEVIARLLPENPFLFPEDQITDRNDRFLAAEIIREKLIRLLGQEVPYAIDVHIEEFVVKDQILHIRGLIIVERPGQKAIVIGEKGQKLKEVGTKARLDMERFFEKKVFLQLWVKVKEGWTDDKKMLSSFGYEE
ncbi:MAG: GTPase Era [Gammaproteobacteria bacterium GWE2_37_16]|nr:MAG: GTPase Era [Gammaproteobacteria bacterium GWE2_37_16]